MTEAREEPIWHRDGLRNFLLFQIMRLQSAKPIKSIAFESFDPYFKKDKPIPADITAFKALLRIPKRNK
jgi:hypothetical protein